MVISVRVYLLSSHRRRRHRRRHHHPVVVVMAAAATETKESLVMRISVCSVLVYC